DNTKTDENKPDPAARDLVESSKALARRVAEISETIEDQNKRPRKTYLGPSTQGVGYAIYYKEMQKRIENIGTLNFPVHNGKKLYGELIVYIPISRDGQIYKKEGGPSIAKSSGNPALDAATLRIIERSAPFGVFPRDLMSDDKDHVWIFSTKFKFTREELLQTEIRGGNNN
uniref:TonB C-terminal domain-containing protein n=1 Tax=Undibacterium sp. TaxID=1914977 RepID=UPI00374D9EE8